MRSEQMLAGLGRQHRQPVRFVTDDQWVAG